MNPSLSYFLSAYQDPDDRRSARVVAIIGVWLITLCALTFLLGIGWRDARLPPWLAAGALVFAGALGLLRRGLPRAAGVLLIAGAMGLVTGAATIGQGIRDYVIIGYPVIVLFSSLIDERRLTTVLSSLCAVAGVTWLVAGDAFGWFVPRPSGVPDAGDWILVTAIIVLTASVTELLAGNLRLGAARARAELEERRRAESARRESEERYRALFEHAGDYVLVTELAPDGPPVIVDANEAAAAAHGYTREELIGMPVSALDPEVTPAVAAERGQAMRDGRAVLFEARHRRKDGGEFYVEIKMTPVHIGGRMLILGVERDITARKRAELALQERDIQSQEAEVLAGLGHWEHDHQTGAVSWSEELFRIYGFDPAAPPPSWEQFRELIHPDDRARVRGRFEAAIRPAETGWDDEFRVRRRDGGERHVRVRYRVDRNPMTGRWRTFGTDQDVTELRLSEARFSKAFHSNPVALLIVRVDDGWILEVNRAFERLMGYSRAEAVGRTTLELNLWVDPAVRTALVPVLMRDGRIAGIEVPFRAKDGSIRVCDYSAERFDLGGEVCTLSAVVDLSDRLKTEAERQQLADQLFQSQKLESLGTLAAGIAHDFNNILSIIVGNTEMLEWDATPSAEMAERLEAIKTATGRGTQLVRQLLTIARKTGTHRSALIVNQLVLEAVKLIGETFPKTIVVSLDLDPAVATIEADQGQLHQVLLNLCVNARDAMPGGGTLGFGTSMVAGDVVRHRWPEAAAAAYVRILVRDTGTGMDEKTQRHIFDPFFTTKDIGKGTGLGLSVAQSIVQAHGGFITVTSHLGEGSAFDILLPASARAAESDRAPEQTLASAPGGTETILVVEDEEAARRLVVALLSSKGYHPITAADGAAGVDAYAQRAGQIDLVLSDLGLPAFSGEEVHRRIRAIDPAVPFILMSGFIEPERRSALEATGVSAVVTKPFSTPDLLGTIRSVLDARTRDAR